MLPRPTWPGGRGGRRRHHQASLLGVAIALLNQIATMPRKPPVTLALVALNVLAYLSPEGFEFIPSIRNGCLNPGRILAHREWARLLWGPLLHADELHLFYNMSSLLWKGAQLEPRLGSTRFARLVASLAALSNALYVGLAAALSSRALLSGRSPMAALGHGLMRSCAVGFSGVLFGLKVVLNWDLPGWSEVYGVALPTKHICWAELLLVQVLVPSASFWGHLCGILAGLIYVAVLPRLAPVLRGGGHRGGGCGAGGAGGAGRGRRTYGRGTWGGGAGEAAGGGGAGAAGAYQYQAGGQTDPLAAGLGGKGGLGSGVGSSSGGNAFGLGLEKQLGAAAAGAGGSAGQGQQQQGPRQRRTPSGTHKQSRASGSSGGGRGSSSDNRGSGTEGAAGRNGGGAARDLSPLGLRLLAAVTLYAVLALAWATNPSSPRAGFWAQFTSSPLQHLRWLAAKAGLGHRLINCRLFSLLQVPPMGGAGTLGGGHSAWFLGAFGRWRELPVPAGAALDAAVAAGGLVARQGPWFLQHAEQYVGDCLLFMQPSTRVLVVAMCLVWLAWRPARLRQTMRRLFEVSPDRGLLPQAPALALSTLSHSSLRHLAVNVASVVLVAGPVEQLLGASALLQCFLVGGAVLLGAALLQRSVAAHLSALLLPARWQRARGSGAAAEHGGERDQAGGQGQGIKGAEPGLYVLLGIALAQQAAAAVAQLATYSTGTLLGQLAHAVPPEHAQRFLALVQGVGELLSLLVSVTALPSSPVLLVCGRVAAEQLLLPLGAGAPPPRPSGVGGGVGAPRSRAGALGALPWHCAAALLRIAARPLRAALLLLLRSAALPALAGWTAARWARRNLLRLACLLVVAELAACELLLMLAGNAAVTLRDGSGYAAARLGCVAAGGAVLAADACWRLAWRGNRV